MSDDIGIGPMPEPRLTRIEQCSRHNSLEKVSELRSGEHPLSWLRTLVEPLGIKTYALDAMLCIDRFSFASSNMPLNVD